MGQETRLEQEEDVVRKPLHQSLDILLGVDNLSLPSCQTNEADHIGVLVSDEKALILFAVLLSRRRDPPPNTLMHMYPRQ